MKTVTILIVSCLLAACQSFAPASPESVVDRTRLASVKSIYIDDLGREEGASLIEGSAEVREMIRAGLAKSGRFSIVQSPQEADAILSGLAGIEKWYHGMEGFYGLEGDLDTHHLGLGRLRLVDSGTKQPIWTHEYKRGLLKLHQGVAERVGEQVVERLLQDVSQVDSRKTGTTHQ